MNHTLPSETITRLLLTLGLQRLWLPHHFCLYPCPHPLCVCDAFDCWFSDVSHWYCLSWSQEPNWEAAGSNFSRVHRGELCSFAHYVCELARGDLLLWCFFHHTFLSLVPSSLLVLLFLFFFLAAYISLFYRTTCYHLMTLVIPNRLLYRIISSWCKSGTQQWPIKIE